MPRTRAAKSTVLKVSGMALSDDAQQPTINVFDEPPRELIKSFVRAESRYGTRGAVDGSRANRSNPRMTLPSV